MSVVRYFFPSYYPFFLNEVCKIDNKKRKIVFDEPQRAITKGQSVVMYNGDVVVGGGIIC